MANALQKNAAAKGAKRRGISSTPQTVRAREDQVRNSAGGFVFQVGDFERLQRFLVLGTEGGTYYVSENKLTTDNAKVVERCLVADYVRTIDQIVRCSVDNLAPKNDQAIFALAIAAAHSDPNCRRYALSRLGEVCRIGTHLFMFMEFSDGLRGRGQAFQKAVSRWYTDRDISSLQTQLVKYQSRGAWSHRDVLRVVRPTPRDDEQATAFRWAVSKDNEAKAEYDFSDLELIAAFETAKTASEKELCKLIEHEKMSWEMVPSEMLKSKAVWSALLPNMGLTALLRNLGRLTSIGLLTPLSEEYRFVATKITDANGLKRARVHPFAVLLAANQYAQGQGFRGSLTWKPVPKLNDALDDAFHAAFGSVVPANKRTMLALDVSGSMESSKLQGTNLSARSASAAMALVTLRTEPFVDTVAFTSGGRNFHRATRSQWGGMYNSGISQIDLSPKASLRDTVRNLSNYPLGGTDCAQPMIYAKARKLDVDTFVIYTDNETWAGEMQPFEALRQYRQFIGHDAKLIVVGMTATGFSIADPRDKGMMDVVGFDASAPNVMAQFSAGNL